MIRRFFVVFMSIAISGFAGCQKAGEKTVAEPVVAPDPVEEGLKLDASIPFEQNIPAFPMKGNPNALVTVLAYMDYRCAHCLSADAKIMKVLEDNPGNVRLAVLPMPNESDPISMTAAKALIAAHVLGKFWEMHDVLIKNSSSLTDTFIKYQMTTLGLEEAEYTKIMESEKTSEFINKIIASAKSRGLTSTPSFLINGELLVGDQPSFIFQDKIDSAIQLAGTTSNSKNLTGEALFRDLSNSKADTSFEPTIFESQPNSPVLGDHNAIVTIEFFSDFACDHCATIEPTIKELLNIYKGKIKFIYRHTPFVNKTSALAHHASEAAKLQGKFWEYAEKLYADQSSHNRENFIKIAESLGLDVNKFTSDMESQEVIDRVNADLKSAFALDIRSLPCLRMNGTAVFGARSLDDYKYFIDKEIKRAQLYVDKGMKGKELYNMLVKTPVDPTSLAASPSKGAPDAPITIIEFGDFQCQTCADVSRSINTLLNDPKFAGKFKVYFKHKLGEGHNSHRKPQRHLSMRSSWANSGNCMISCLSTRTS